MKSPLPVKKKDYPRTGRRRSLYRKKTLKRGVELHLFKDSDIKWFWLAFQMGAFEELKFSEDQKEFTEQLLIFITDIMTQGGFVYIISAKSTRRADKNEVTPVGVVMVNFYENAAWPHVIWFPWASSRNKLEGAVFFIQELKKQMPILIIAKESDAPFFSHLSRYALLSRGCKINKHFGDENGILFRGVQ